MKFKKSFLYSLQIFFIPFLCSSQTTDSNLKDIKKISLFSNTNNDSLIYYSLRLIKSKDKCLEFKGMTHKAKAYYQKGEYLIAEKISLDILDKLKKEDTKCHYINKIDAYNRLFWIKKNQYKLEEAFDLLIRRLGIVNKLKDNNLYYFRNKVSIKFNMASIKSDLGFHKEAIIIYKEVYKEYSNTSINLLKSKKQSYFLFQTSVLNSIGNSYYKLVTNNTHYNYLDSASTYFFKAFQIAKKIKPLHKQSEMIYDLRRSRILLKKEDYRASLNVINKHSVIKKELPFRQDLYFLKSVIYEKTNERDSSIYYGMQYINNDRKTSNESKGKVIIYNILADQYNMANEIDSAYKYSQLAVSELKKHNKSNINASKYNYDYNFKKVKKVNEAILKKERKERKNTILYFSLALLTLSISLYFLLTGRKKIIRQYLLTKNHLEKVLNPIKKEYNINGQLEIKILERINKMEKTKIFLDSKFNLAILAKKLKTNTSYLSKIINKNKGKSYKKYIAELRINHLIENLRIDQKLRKHTIKALAEGIGYTNASAFTRAFKKYKGVTPSEYLKSLK